MRKISDMQEIRQMQMNMLRYIKETCEQNKLTYFLSGGTLLGAVRHQGFIPWDDDVDVMMPRKDYDQFVNIVNRENNKYFMYTIYTEKTYYYDFGRLIDKDTILIERDHFPIRDLGLGIDIFPMDGLPTKNVILKNHILHVQKLHQISESLRQTNKYKDMDSIKYKCHLFLAKLVSFSCDIYARMYRFDHSNHIACVVGLRGMKEIMPRKPFSEGILLKFEGEYFAVPKGYKIYLQKLYGDYMKLPPVSQRGTSHGFCVYNKRN